MKAGAKQAIMRARGALVAASSMIMCCPALAFAAEENKNEGAELLIPDLNEFIPMLVCFIILVVVLAKIGWPAFAGMMEKREAAMKSDLEKAEDARIESEKLLEEYKKQLAEAKTQSAQIIADAKKTGETAKAEITAKAQAEAESMIEKARLAIESEKKRVIAELQGSVADASIAVATRVIGQDLSDDEHRAIIERYVNEAGSLNA